MKIQANSKTYNQLKAYFTKGIELHQKTFTDYEKVGLSLTRYIWDMFWAGIEKSTNYQASFKFHQELFPENGIMIDIDTIA